MIHAKVAENIKTHLMFKNFFFENRVVYKIMWKNTVDPDRPQMTILRMRIACCIPKTKNTYLEYLIKNTVIPLQARCGLEGG